MTTQVQTESVQIPVAESGEITATIFQPPGVVTGVLTIHSATATPQHYYSTFAGYAAARGLAVITYDYRGTGLSGDPRDHSHLRMRDWMQVDVPTVADWSQTRFPDLPHFALGHSIGGHALSLGNGTENLLGAVIVSAHIAATRTIAPLSERIRVAMLLGLIGPAVSRTVGFMPGKKLGLGEDITSSAMIEWGRWARLPGYFFDDPSMNAVARARSVRLPLLAVGTTDDLWASPAQMDAFMERMMSAEVTRRTYSPADLGVKSLGHHGILRRRVGESTWPELIDWLLERLPGNQP